MNSVATIPQPLPSILIQLGTLSIFDWFSLFRFLKISGLNLTGLNLIHEEISNQLELNVEMNLKAESLMKGFVELFRRHMW